jgi:hypothetical protein
MSTGSTDCHSSEHESLQQRSVTTEVAMGNQGDSVKRGVIAGIESAWAELGHFLAGLSEAQMTALHDAHGWTVKDHLTHLAAWEESVVFFLQGRPRHEALGVEQTHLANASFDEINAIIQRRQVDLSVAEATAQLRATHARLLSLLQPLSDADLGQPLRHLLPSSPPDDQRRAVDLIRDNTSGHFLEHLPWMRAIAQREQL